MTQTIKRPDDVSEQVWNDFLLVRKAKRAPLTETALKRLRNEAEAAMMSLEEAIEECVLRGWQSFKEEWVNKNQGNQLARRAC